MQDLKLQAPHEAGLIKESSSYVRSSPKKGFYWDPLPKLKLKKSALSRRDRIGAEKRRAAITLNIKDTKKEPRIEEELALEDRALYDSDFQPFIDLTKGREQKEGKKLNSDLIKASPIKKSKTPEQSDRKIQPKWSLRNKLCALVWKAKITKEITIFNSRKRQHSTGQNVNGWVNQFSSKTFSQAVPWNFGINGYMLREKASLHWVCISNMKTNKCNNGTHYVYDSLRKPNVMLDIAKQVASYSCHKFANKICTATKEKS